MPPQTPSAAVLTVNLAGIGSLVLDLGNVATFSLATPSTAPSWVVPQATCACDFVNNRYWAAGSTTTLSALVGGSPNVSASGLRCNSGDLPVAIGQLQSDLNAFEGFLVVKWSASPTGPTFPRILDIQTGYNNISLDPTGVGDLSPNPSIGFNMDGMGNNFSIAYNNSIVNTVALGWNSGGASGVLNQATVLKGTSTPKVISTAGTPYLGNRVGNDRYLGGYILYIATGTPRPTDTLLRTYAP